MKGDFSRSTFDPHKHYTSVRMQQGRVQLDADWNEQADILLHLIVTQLQDLLGPGGTTVTKPGFAITLVEPAEEPVDQGQAGLPDEDEAGQWQEPTQPARSLPDFWIGAGRYYVDGVLCENEAPVLFSRQPDYPDAASRLGEPGDHDHFLVYLDVWGRHITAVQDPAMREIALGGPDTTTRVKTVWQVKLWPLSGDLADDHGWRDRGGLRSLPGWEAFVAQATDRGRLQAKWEKDKGAFLENSLYRVEIHTVADGQVTFKWSRENGSVVFPITAVDPSPAQEDNKGTLRVTVEDLDRDPYQLQEGFWVELVDDVTVLSGRPLPLCQVKELDPPNARITLHAEQDVIDQILAEIRVRELRHPLLRRWEAETKPVVRPENTASHQGDGWSELDNGIQVAFISDTGTYQVGDYWLIPARTRSKDGIEWPQKDGQPLAQAPHGIAHHYAPLALLQFQEGGWSVIPPDEATTFRSLPQITDNLITTDGQLEKVRETVDTMVKQTHVFENFKSEAPLEKGDVVCIDRAGVEGPTDPGRLLPVKLASLEDAQMVVGVVWEPIDHDSQLYRIAVYGRVRAKVIGEVKPGDLLVPSPVPGHAQRAGLFLRPGTILGKALSLTQFEPEVVEEIEEGRRPVEAGLSQQPGSVDMLVTLA
jgi:hypothetical protein